MPEVRVSYRYTQPFSMVSQCRIFEISINLALAIVFLDYSKGNSGEGVNLQQRTLPLQSYWFGHLLSLINTVTISFRGQIPSG